MEAVHQRGRCQCGLGAARLKEPQSRATMGRAPIQVPRGQLRQARGVSQSGPANQIPRLPKKAFPRPSVLSEHASLSRRGQAERPSHVVAAAPGDTTARWWEREGGPNVRDVHSIGDFVEELAGAGDKLVVVEFYASWCGSCRALLPKFLKIAAEHPEVTFLKVNFDECKAMCKSLNIKVLPFFHFYRGADGRLDAFSASISKLAKLREAIEIHNTDRCSLGPAIGVGPDFDWEAAAKANAAAAAAAKSAATH